MSQETIWVKSIPNEENSLCKGPVAEISLAHLKPSKPRVIGVRECKVVGGEVREVGRGPVLPGLKALVRNCISFEV